VTNSGPAFEAELKGSAIFPDASRVNLFGPTHVVTVPAGQTDFPLVSLVVADSAPVGFYLLDVALTDVASGITRARANLSASKPAP
jgi:hypothetical protein